MSPVAEERKTPTSEEYGQATQNAEFVQQTTPAPEGAPAAAEAPFGKAAALPPQPIPEGVLEPLGPQEKPTPNMVGDLNLDEILLGPTQRPGEPITAGAQGVAPPKIADTLEQLAGMYQTYDLEFLAKVARNAGL